MLGESGTSLKQNSLKDLRKQSWQANDYKQDSSQECRIFIETLDQDRASPNICYNSAYRKKLDSTLKLESEKIGVFVKQHSHAYQTYDLQFRQTQSVNLREIETFYEFDMEILQTLDIIDQEIVIKNVGLRSKLRAWWWHHSHARATSAKSTFFIRDKYLPFKTVLTSVYVPCSWKAGSGRWRARSTKRWSFSKPC